MITLLHGDDTVNSRKTYAEMKSLYADSITFDGDSVTLTDLTQELAGGGLFVEEKHVFIEQLLGKKKSPVEKEACIELINKYGQASTVVLWEAKEIDKKTLSIFSKAQNRLFKLPQTLFTLMDSIKPNNTIQLLDLFHRTIETTEQELVFFMLIRQIRLLLAFSDPKTLIDETKRIAPWQKGKLVQQASLFPKEKLVTLHKKLYEIERNMKTGGLTMSLSSTIDIFLTEV